jgi:hypothetical protein
MPTLGRLGPRSALLLTRAREELGVGAHTGDHRLDLVATGYL